VILNREQVDEIERRWGDEDPDDLANLIQTLRATRKERDDYRETLDGIRHYRSKLFSDDIDSLIDIQFAARDVLAKYPRGGDTPCTP
jgi:hypothetical protein